MSDWNTHLYCATKVNEELNKDFEFNPQGRTNSDANYNEYLFNGQNILTTTNFDWKKGGWTKDIDGVNCFVVKAGSRAILDYQMFNQQVDLTAKGMSYKIIYKIKDKKLSTIARCFLDFYNI